MARTLPRRRSDRGGHLIDTGTAPHGAVPVWPAVAADARGDACHLSTAAPARQPAHVGNRGDDGYHRRMTLHLHIGAEDLRFSAGADSAQAATATSRSPTLTLPLGMRTLRRNLSRFPPREAELEQLIADVEDVLMPQVARIRQLAPLPLASADAVFGRIAEVAGVSAQANALLDIDAVERVFNRLASVAAGHPARHEGIPEDLDFVAALVLLREVMHHAGFPALSLDAR